VRVPLGEFGYDVARAAPVVDKSGVFQAARDVFVEGQRAHDRVEAEQRQERQQLQRAKAHNASLDYELEVQAAAQTTAADVESGAIDYNTADAELEKRITTIKRPQVELEDPVDIENFDYVLKSQVARAGKALVPVVRAARGRDGLAQVDRSFDSLGKLAGLPDADIDAINAEARQVAANARTFGVPKDIADRKLQDFIDRNWTNQATQRQIEGASSMALLKALEHDLTAKDGFYAKKLDPEKRNILLRGVQADMDRIIARAEAEANRRGARAVKVLNEIDTQIATGVPAKPEAWVSWAAQVKGTEFEEDFKERVADEQVVQEVLRRPVAEQMKLVQDREAKLTSEGGTVREVANLKRLDAAVKRNVALLQAAPLLFNANRSGEQADPIDFSRAGDPAANLDISEKLRQRTIALGGMRAQYGVQVPLRPLLPQEAQQLGGALDAATPKQAAEMFAVLREATGDDKTFRGMLAQLAPDSPVRAVAGVLASKQRALTMVRNWIADDVVAGSRDVAATILEGEAALNPSKAAKGKDGKPDRSLVMPGDEELQTKFKDEVGDAFAGRPGARDTAWQAVKAYYAGKATQTGRIAANAQDVDGDLVRESVKAVLGNAVDYNGRGTVFAPWGMSESQFDDAVAAQLAAEAKRRNVKAPASGRLPERVLGLEEQFGEIGLRQRGDNTYIVTSGRGNLIGADGGPLTITVGE
jgi:hypothetical protein